MATIEPITKSVKFRDDLFVMMQVVILIVLWFIRFKSSCRTAVYHFDCYRMEPRTS